MFNMLLYVFWGKVKSDGERLLCISFYVVFQ